MNALRCIVTTFLASYVLLASCAIDQPADLIEIRGVRPEPLPSTPGLIFSIVFGANFTKEARRLASEDVKGATGALFIEAEQRAALAIASRELKQRGLCDSEVRVVAQYRHFDHSLMSNIVVQCAAA